MARAPINGSTLRWARETMFVERGELARAAGTSEGRIAEFETGDARPTLRQLENIANKLDRTLAFFFTEPADFRAGNGEPIPPLLAREMRRAEQHRDTVLELEGRPEKPALVGAINRRNLAARANEIRDLLGLTEDFAPPGGRDNRVLSFWRGLLERHGFLTFQATKIELAVFRGLSIHHDVLPIILLWPVIIKMIAGRSYLMNARIPMAKRMIDEYHKTEGLE